MVAEISQLWSRYLSLNNDYFNRARIDLGSENKVIATISGPLRSCPEAWKGSKETQEMEREVAEKVDAEQYAKKEDIQKKMEQKERLRVEEKREL